MHKRPRDESKSPQVSLLSVYLVIKLFSFTPSLNLFVSNRPSRVFQTRCRGAASTGAPDISLGAVATSRAASVTTKPPLSAVKRRKIATAGTSPYQVGSQGRVDSASQPCACSALDHRPDVCDDGATLVRQSGRHVSGPFESFHRRSVGVQWEFDLAKDLTNITGDNLDLKPLYLTYRLFMPTRASSTAQPIHWKYV
jgi:hypothetical protein